MREGLAKLKQIESPDLKEEVSRILNITERFVQSLVAWNEVESATKIGWEILGGSSSERTTNAMN